MIFREVSLHWPPLKEELHIQYFQARLVRVAPKITGQWYEEELAVVLVITWKVPGAKVDDHPALVRVDHHTHSYLPQPALVLQMARQLGTHFPLQKRGDLCVNAWIYCLCSLQIGYTIRCRGREGQAARDYSNRKLQSVHCCSLHVLG